MNRYFAKGSPPFFAVVIGSGLIAILLVVLAVQAMPVFGWILWAFTTAGVLAGASFWYRNEFARGLAAEDDSRMTTSRNLIARRQERA